MSGIDGYTDSIVYVQVIIFYFNYESETGEFQEERLEMSTGYSLSDVEKAAKEAICRKGEFLEVTIL